MKAASLQKILASNQLIINKLIVPVDPVLEAQRAFYENSYYEFLKAAWHTIEGNKPFVEGWLPRALCEHIELVYKREIRDLLCNVPPRCCKSITFSIAFIAWAWTKTPALQFLCISYGQRLAEDLSVKCKRIIESNWYQKLWGHKVQLSPEVNNKGRFDNLQGGYRIATSVGGATTGFGADVIIIDDSNDVGSSESEVVRDTTNDWCDYVVSTRGNDPKTVCFLGVQQRTHFQDFSGHALEKKIPGLVHLCLPMEFEQSSRSKTVALPSSGGQIWEDPRAREGELLWPERFGKEEVEKIKSGLKSEFAISGQLQQRPTPGEGGIFKRHYMRMYKDTDPPECWFIIQSWDTAHSVDDERRRDKSDVASSACTTWGVFKNEHNVDSVILLSLWEGKVEYPDLRKMAQRLSANYYDTDFKNPWNAKNEPHLILIEAKANGMDLIADLRRAGVLATDFNPNQYGDKPARARRISHYFECGRVWFMGQPPYYNKYDHEAERFIEAALHFPKDKWSKDIIDSASQAFIRLSNDGYISHRDDLEYDVDYKGLIRQAEMIHGA